MIEFSLLKPLSIPISLKITPGPPQGAYSAPKPPAAFDPPLNP